MEAIANQAHKKEEKRVHPMFRRTSTSRSTSTSTNGLDDEKPRKRRKLGEGGGVKEEPIDLVDSDDDLDGFVKADAGGIGGRSVSPKIDEEVKGDPSPVTSGERSAYPSYR